jgi:hypothetical protein
MNYQQYLAENARCQQILDAHHKRMGRISGLAVILDIILVAVIFAVVFRLIG